MKSHRAFVASGADPTFSVVVATLMWACVHGKAVAQSPSPILNEAAIDAALGSTFATRILDCVPVGDTYNFIVDFEPAATLRPGPPAAMVDYFIEALVHGDGRLQRRKRRRAHDLREVRTRRKRTVRVRANAVGDVCGPIIRLVARSFEVRRVPTSGSRRRLPRTDRAVEGKSRPVARSTSSCLDKCDPQTLRSGIRHGSSQGLRGRCPRRRRPWDEPIVAVRT
jgi:hypothetical protein